jgi:hypothetical protein
MCTTIFEYFYLFIFFDSIHGPLVLAFALRVGLVLIAAPVSKVKGEGEVRGDGR